MAVIGVPLTVNAFGFAYRHAFHVLICCLGAIALAGRGPRLCRGPVLGAVLVPLAALWGLGVVGAAWSLDRAAALTQVLDRTALLVTLVLVVDLARSLPARRQLVAAAVIGCGIVAVWGVLQVFGIHPFIERSVWRSSWPTRPLGTHNLMGGYMVAWLPVSFLWFLVARGPWRFVLGVIVLVSWSCFLLSGSRGAWLAGVAMVGLVLPWVVRGGWAHLGAAVRVAPRSATVVCGLMVLVAVAGAGRVTERVRTPARTIVEGGAAESARNEVATGTVSAPVVGLTSIQRRVAIAEGALELGRHRPILGHGPGSFRLAFYTAKPPLMQRLEAVTGETAVHAHWDLLELLVEYGLVGVALVLLGMTTAVTLGWRRLVAAVRATGKLGDAELLIGVGLWMGCVGLCTHALVDFDFHEVPTALAGVILLGLVAGVQGTGAVEREVNGRRWARGLAALVLVATVVATGLAAASEVQHRRAFATLQGGDLAGAERRLQRALRLGPDRAVFEVALGEIGLHRQRRAATPAESLTALEQAAGRFERAAGLEPGVARHAYRAATCWQQAAVLGSVDGRQRAMRWTVEAARRNPYVVEAHVLAARLHREAGNLDAAAMALAAARAAREGRDRLPAIQIEAARLARARGEGEQATKLFAAAAEQSTQPDIYEGLLAMAGEAGEPAGPSARAELQRLAGGGGPQAVAATLALGDLALGEGDLGAAERWIEEAARHGAGAGVLVRRGDLAYRIGRLDEATRLYKGAVQAEPLARGLTGLARIALARGDTTRALVLVTRAFAARPLDPELPTLLAQIRDMQAQH